MSKKTEETGTKQPKRGVGTVAMEAIKGGKTNEQALEAVKKEFPDAKTSLPSINWYRQHMRKTDKTVATNRELAKKDAPKKDAPKAGGKKDPLD